MYMNNINYEDFNSIWAAGTVSLTCSGPGVGVCSQEELKLFP